MTTTISIDYDNEYYSGYYLVDCLWARINEVWRYILSLFDVKLNTLVSIKLVKSKDSKAIYNFLKELLRNQKKKSIEVDLKHEYREIIDKLLLNIIYVNFM